MTRRISYTARVSRSRLACLSMIVVVALSVRVAEHGRAEQTRPPAPVRAISNTLGTGPTLETPDVYAELANLGYRAILSVDGRPSDVAAAEAVGLIVAHVPIGYDALDDDELAHLARAWTDLPRPLYVHCHHGRLRGPAVAALFHRWNGASRAAAEDVLTHCHFDPRYAALQSSIHRDRPTPTMEGLVKRSDVEPLTRAMLSLEDALERLADDRSDEAALLWTEAVTETDRASTTDPNWDAQQWRTALEVFQATPPDPAAIYEQCAACHAKNKWR